MTNEEKANVRLTELEALDEIDSQLTKLGTISTTSPTHLIKKVI